MNLNDVKQKFEGSIVLYAKRPVLFIKVAGDMSCRIYDLMKQEEEQVQFELEKFTPPPPRIGMVNVANSVVYVTRTPMRRYSLGLTKETLCIDTLDCVYPDGAAMAEREIGTLKSKALGSTLLNKFPTKQQAFRRISQFAGTVAIDKQFAVDSNGVLWYKREQVGKHNFNQLFFNEDYEHLQILLDKSYEKSK